MRSWIRWVAAVLAVVAVAGCSGPDGESAAAGGVTGGTFPLTITHAQGTTTVPTAPTRIVALSGEEDTLALLGIAPVAYGEGFGLTGRRAPWLEGQRVLDAATVLPDAQSNPVNIEQVAALRPDLILATNLYSIAEFYPQLSAIAPTIGVPQGREAGASSWQELSTYIGRSVGREPDARAAVEQTGERLREFGSGLPGLAGKSFTTNFYFQPGSVVTVSSVQSGANALLSELGMRLAPGVQQGQGSRTTLTLEQIGRVDADFVAMGYANDSLRSELTGNALFRSLGAVRDGRVGEMSPQASAASNNPTILNVAWQLDNFRPVLERVAAG